MHVQSTVDWQPLLWVCTIWPKCWEISVQNRIECSGSFQKLTGTHLENFGQLLEVVFFSFFFSEIWKFWKFPVLFGISTLYESDLVPPAVDIASTKATRLWQPVNTTLMQYDLSQFEPFYWLPILHKNVRISFSGKLWTGSEFPVGICPVCIIFCEKSSQVSHHTQIILESVG